MFTRLKICGITRAEDARMCVNLGVDILGFNFYRKSPRYIEPAAAREIVRDLPFHISIVGILVKPSLPEALAVLKTGAVDALQIYEPQDFHFREIPAAVIQAYRIKPGEPLPSLPADGARMVLLDCHSPDVYGGSGQAFDWQQIPETIPRQQLALAGGIHPGNIQAALQQVHPAIIDVASGGEIAPGRKDADKIRTLVQAVYRFNLSEHRENQPPNNLNHHFKNQR